MEQIMKLLMEMDEDLTRQEAKEQVKEMRRRVLEDGESPEDVLLEEGIDADYVFDLLY